MSYSIFGNSLAAGSPVNYGDALKQWTPEQWQSFGAAGGTIGDDYLMNYGSSGGLASTTLTAGDYIQGAGMFGNLYNTYLGDGKDIAAKQMQGIDANIKLANQQVKANKQAMADRKQFNNTWANASNGLAASYANKVG